MRRGQVALEFLATYGWALMIVLVMIATISYFGVLNPGKLLPSRCTVGAELACEDFQLANEGGQGYLRLILGQSVGRTIYADSLTCMFGDAETTVDLSGRAWPPSDELRLECELPAFVGMEGQKTKVLYEITYRRSQTGFTHLVAGDVYTEVQ